MFKRYECGCIGFVTHGLVAEGERKHAWCIQPCDTDRDDDLVAVFRRDDLQYKRSVKLHDDEVDALLMVLAGLVSDGNALRHLRNAMRVAGLS